MKKITMQRLLIGFDGVFSNSQILKKLIFIWGFYMKMGSQLTSVSKLLLDITKEHLT
jgi:hypothetical protein